MKYVRASFLAACASRQEAREKSFVQGRATIGGEVLAGSDSATGGTLSIHLHSSLKCCLVPDLQLKEKMSDDAAPVKRGRKANTEKAAEKDTKAETKKRARKEVKAADGDSNDESSAPAKRGRGRPKGSTKKKAAPKPKAKGTGTGRRGRPKKEETKDSEDGEDDDAAEEDDD